MLKQCLYLEIQGKWATIPHQSKFTIMHPTCLFFIWIKEEIVLIEKRGHNKLWDQNSTLNQTNEKQDSKEHIKKCRPPISTKISHKSTLIRQ